jgi:hypothetical protein
VFPCQVYDPSVAAWLLEPDSKSYQLDEIIFALTGTNSISGTCTNVERIQSDFERCSQLWPLLSERFTQNDIKMAILEHEMLISHIVASTVFFFFFFFFFLVYCLIPMSFYNRTCFFLSLFLSIIFIYEFACFFSL